MRFIELIWFLSLVGIVIVAHTGCVDEESDSTEFTVPTGAGGASAQAYTNTNSESGFTTSSGTRGAVGEESDSAISLITPTSGAEALGSEGTTTELDNEKDTSGAGFAEATCGNTVIDPGEQCESGLAITATCESLGKGSGVVTCTQDCFYDTSSCVPDQEIDPMDNEQVNPPDNEQVDPPGNEVVDPSGSDIEFIVNHEMSSAIGTVGIVTWSTNLAQVSEAVIEFGLDTTYGMEAPVDLSEPGYRTLLLGMKGSQEYHYRVVAKNGNTEYKSQDYTLNTGPVTNRVQVLEMNVEDETVRAPGFIVSSLYQMGGGRLPGTQGGAQSMAFIVDGDGEIVWWHTSSLSNIARARMSYDGRNMWMVTVGQGATNHIERVTMDGLDSEVYPIGATHDITAVTGDVMAFPGGGFNDCVVITEITPDGTTTPVFDTGQIWSGGDGLWGAMCHANAIRYSEAEGLYSMSDLMQNDIIMIERSTGNLVQRLSDYSFAWGGRQHGHHFLGDSIVIFNNGQRISQEIQLRSDTLQSSEIWRYGSSYNSETLGDVQRLPNGNTMVTYSTAGRVHEVDSDRNRVMEIRFSSAIGYTIWRESLYGPPPDITLSTD